MFEQRIRKELNTQLDARQPLARFLARQRQDFGLKVVALSISILLYFYVQAEVQAERNPIQKRTLNVAVTTTGIPSDMGVDLDKTQGKVKITVSGPSDLVERISEKDIFANVNLSKVTPDAEKTQSLYASLDLTRLDKDTAAKVTFEPMDPKVTLYLLSLATKQLPVEANYPSNARSGSTYGPPDVRPPSVKVIGRSDRVNRVAKLLIEAAPIERGEPISGEYPVDACDSEGKLVENVRVDPPTVHLSVPLRDRPSSRLMTISMIPSGLPVPPYFISKITVTPAQVRVVGNTDALTNTSIIETEPLPLSEMTETREITAYLIVPGNLILHDLNDRPIDKVKVRIEIEKAPDSTLPKPKTDAEPTPIETPKTK